MQSAEYMSTAFIENLYSTGTIFTQIPWLPPQLSTQAAFVQFPQATGKQLSGCTEVYNAERSEVTMSTLFTATRSSVAPCRNTVL